jgi:hypothetical protein
VLSILLLEETTNKTSDKNGTLYKTAASHKTSQNSKNANREQHPSSTTVTTRNDAFERQERGKQQNQNLDSSLDIGFKNSVEPQELIIAGHGVRRAPLLVEVILLILLAQHIYSSENIDHTHDADNLLLFLLFTILVSSPSRLISFFLFLFFVTFSSPSSLRVCCVQLRAPALQQRRPDL